MARMTYAQAACTALEDAMRRDANVVVVGEDVGRGGIFGQYRGLQQAFGAKRVIDTPISESTILGAAVGMALAGLKPVVEMRVVDFALCAIDELVNQAAKARYMFGGQGRVGMVARLPNGLWAGSAAQHSQSLEAWFAHIPGLVVVAPATPQDNHALLAAALASGDPVVYLEHKELWGLEGEVAPAARAQLGEAEIAHPGSDVTVVTWSKTRHAALEAAALAEKDGVSLEVIDLRTIWPWDRDTVLASAERTGRVLIAHEAVQVAGFGAEIAHPGSDVTVVTWSKTRHAALEAAALAEKDGVSLEVIDLRTIWPWDRDTVLASAERTGRVLIAHEAVQVAGFGAEIAATLAEASGARVRRLGAPRIPVGYSLPLEDESRITPRAIAAACVELRRARPAHRG